MLKEREIRDQLQAYLGRAIPLQQFSVWLYGVSLDIEEQADQYTQDLVYEILARVAEHSNAGFSENDLRAVLVKIASTFTVPGVYQTRSNSWDLETPKALVAP